MTTEFRIALLGFSDFERRTLGAYFRLATGRVPSYRLGQPLGDSAFIVADADHPASVQLVAATERMGETVFIGAEPPEGASAWMPRPIDPLHLLRELDAMVALRQAPAPAAPQLDVRPAPPPPPPSPPPPAVRAAAPAPAPPDDGWIYPPPPPPPTALLVDDSPIALRFLQTRLQRWGIATAEAASSERALALLAEQDYDFVFVDVELGDDSALDGLTLCQQIKRTQSERSAIASSVFIVSAHHGELDRVRATLAGCDAFLAKPLHDEELARLLQQHGLQPPPRVPAADVIGV